MSCRYCDDPFGFAPLWDAILEIYDNFHLLCDRRGLRHYVIGGTLLGAVRHKGFIPWDDDFDVAMPRPDYEKFRQIVDRELPSHLRFVDRHNTPEFAKLFGKIQDIRTDRIKSIEEVVGHQLSNGIFIDIFPIDGYPETGKSAVLHRFMMILYAMAYRFSARKNIRPATTINGRLARIAGSIVAPFLEKVDTVDRYCDVMERFFTKFKYSDDGKTGLAAFEIEKYFLVLGEKVWGDSVRLQFVDREVDAPADWNQYLRKSYGDYMKLPPLSKRIPTHEYADRMPWCLGPTLQK